VQPVLQVPVVPGVPLGPRPLPVMARVPLQQDQQVQLVQLGQAVPGVVGELHVLHQLRRVEAQQHRVEHVQVDKGAGLVRVAVGLLRLVLIPHEVGHELDGVQVVGVSGALRAVIEGLVTQARAEASDELLVVLLQLLLRVEAVAVARHVALFSHVVAGFPDEMS